MVYDQQALIGSGEGEQWCSITFAVSSYVLFSVKPQAQTIFSMESPVLSVTLFIAMVAALGIFTVKRRR
jgi:hypothetical protein